MNITKEQVDALNAIVTVAITKEDYSDKVAEILNDYRKSNYSRVPKRTCSYGLGKEAIR